jgi:hypothetical protein
MPRRGFVLSLALLRTSKVNRIRCYCYTIWGERDQPALSVGAQYIDYARRFSLTALSTSAASMQLRVFSAAFEFADDHDRQSDEWSHGCAIDDGFCGCAGPDRRDQGGNDRTPHTETWQATSSLELSESRTSSEPNAPAKHNDINTPDHTRRKPPPRLPFHHQLPRRPRLRHQRIGPHQPGQSTKRSRTVDRKNNCRPSGSSAPAAQLKRHAA